MDTQRSFVVTARPAEVSVFPDTSAVLVVDMQNDFASSGGMFDRAGIDLSTIRGAIAPSVQVLTAARAAGLRVAYLKMAFRADLSDAGAPDSPTWVKHLPLHPGQEVTAPDGTPSRILVRDTWNTDVIDELAPAPGDAVVYKHRFSGFFETTLDAQLRDWGIRTLIVLGATTSVCVDSTVRDAMFRDYQCLLVEDCMAEPIGSDRPITNHDSTLLVLQTLFASVTTSASLLQSLRSVS